MKRRIPQLIERDGFVFGAERFVFPENRVFFDEIDHADEGIFFADRKLNRNRVCRETLAHRANRMVEISPEAVHLIYKRDARDVILVRLPPDRFRLWLHACHRVENGHCAIEHAKRPLDFNGKIHVTRRINNVDSN